MTYFFPINNIKHAIPELRNITGAEPAVDEGTQIGLCIVMVASANHRTSDEDFARLAGLDIPTIITDHPANG